jgi:hypothetical protein
MKWCLLAILLILILSTIGCTTTSAQTFSPNVTVKPEVHFDFGPTILVLLMFILGLGMYFLPTILAVTRHHVNALAIFIVNFLTGWSLVGWVVALVWSVKKKE